MVGGGRIATCQVTGLDSGLDYFIGETLGTDSLDILFSIMKLKSSVSKPLVLKVGKFVLAIWELTSWLILQ